MQKHGSVSESHLSLNELDALLLMQQWNKDALFLIRETTANRKQALTAQMAQRKAVNSGDIEHMNVCQEVKGVDRHAGVDSKKRRPSRSWCSLDRFWPQLRGWLSFPDWRLTLVSAARVYA
ncbi:uncharacterized protein N7446_007162 [Penicillium canescens]|uniref:Uncharacterized protein n=1 Tax=Penicillium canescens TaxID=5083 RepID=A0AAD6IL33_PENCN|nr:uncharacterized protein N7446_007162 [Penicillium canescens]KAJ6049509.1 hypothetical protein N7444_006225 [Penicillium canescens]KAJ6052522.1 hypothetical protein N7460_003056 [Penicillium canescens]KAJ6063042.1 hypothetical protein N7446_007162 [Penicillium canescens]